MTRRCLLLTEAALWGAVAGACVVVAVAAVIDLRSRL